MRYIDDIFVEKITKHGKSLINNFAILVKLTNIYQSANETVTNTAGRVLNELKPLLGEDGELSLRLAEDSFFIENVRVKSGISDLDNFSTLMKDMSSKMIGSVTFRAPLQAEDITFLAYAIRGGNEAHEIQNTLDSRMAKGISVGGPVSSKKEESIDMKDIRVASRRAYTRTLSSYMAVIKSIKSGRKPNIKKAKRAVQSLVDCILKDENYLLGLTTIRNAEQYSIQHPVNVAIFAMALGQKLALTKYLLCLAGMAALFHDIGKLDIPSSILNKNKNFSAPEMELIKMHPLEGVKYILKTRGINEIAIISMFVSLEHHMGGENGYPVLKGGREPLLFSRMIKISDDFDSLISGRVYERTALSPARALQKMYSDMQTYDEKLFKAFFEIFKRREFSF